MFIVTGPQLVIAACRSGVVGALPSLNQRSVDGYERWLEAIAEGLQEGPVPGVREVAPFAVNLNVHKTNARHDADLALTVKHKVPIVITSLGAVREVVDAIHEYGGTVFHDVISLRHAEKALAAGNDGLIAVTGGAGGHSGTLHPFSFMYELREMTDKLLVLAGAVSTGQQIAAALMAGADMVSMGTRFIATHESQAKEAYKDMLVEARAGDIVLTSKLTGVNATFMAQSLAQNGIDLARMGEHGPASMEVEMAPTSKAWRDIWSAGHGVGAIKDSPSMAELVSRLRAEYRAATGRLNELPY